VTGVQTCALPIYAEHPPAGPGGQAGQAVVITGCTVADGRAAEGASPVEDAGILVQGDRIARVGARREILAAAADLPDVTLVDLGGAYVTPGMVNMHT